MREHIIKWLEDNSLLGNINNIRVFDNRNNLQSELVRLTQSFLQEKVFSEETVYLIFAILGEIGNNSFDHNVGNWPNERGVFFGYREEKNILNFVLADKGQGILKTLKRVRPNLKNDKEALQMAFTEVVSGRAPEARGNGLKFVKNTVKNRGFHLRFYSSNGQAMINDEIKFVENKNNFPGCLAILKIDKKIK